MNIYIAGNSLVPGDYLPVLYMQRLMRSFPRIRFLHVDPNENFPRKGDRDIILIDTVPGIKKPTQYMYGDLLQTATTPLSPHDYDMGMHLFLLKKTGRINSVVIFGIPGKENRRTYAELVKLIEDFSRSI